MDMALIKKAEDFLKANYEEGAYLNSHPSEKAYRLEHSYRVANICRTIGEQEGFDVTALVIAGLLHDVSYCEQFSTQEDWRNHGRTSARIARPFLETLGLSRSAIEDICYGIAIHVDDKADFDGQRNPFAQSIGDADNIDRFDAYRIYQGLEYNQFSSMSLAQKTERVSSVLEQLTNLKNMELGTKTAKAIWLERIDFNIAFYRKLRDQLANSSTIR